MPFKFYRFMYIWPYQCRREETGVWPPAFCRMGGSRYRFNLKWLSQWKRWAWPRITCIKRGPGWAKPKKKESWHWHYGKFTWEQYQTEDEHCLGICLGMKQSLRGMWNNTHICIPLNPARAPRRTQPYVFWRPILITCLRRNLPNDSFRQSHLNCHVC